MTKNLTPQQQAIADAIRQACKVVGGQVQLAALITTEAMPVNQSYIAHWIKRGSVSCNYCPAIERVTNGQIKCEQLCPSVDWEYIRGCCN